MEIEIKFGPVNRETAARIFADPALTLGPVTITGMHTVYYDTPDRTLRREQITLRLRKEGPRSVCTLKTGITGPDGVARRVELEQEAPDILSGAAGLLVMPGLPEEVRPFLRTGRFEATCGARFVRKEAEAVLEDVTFVLSHDQGELYAGDKTEPLSEIELELRSGTPEALVREARRLAEVYGLQLCPDSKQKRAAALEVR